MLNSIMCFSVIIMMHIKDKLIDQNILVNLRLDLRLINHDHSDMLYIARIIINKGI